MGNVSNQYEAGNFFTVRAPLLPFNKYISMPEEEEDYIQFLNQIINDKYLREGIKWASPNLYEMIKLFLESNKPLTSNAYKSISNYFIRMTTRPTPFGLFAGIGIGFGDSKDTRIIINEKLLQKFIRVDREWLNGVIKKFERNDEIIINLKVLMNPNVYISGNRLVNPYKRSNEERKYRIKSTIRLSENVKRVIEKTATPILFKDLVNHLLKKNPTVPKQIVMKFLLQLIEEEYLISELRLQILNVEPLAELISIVEKFNNRETELLYKCLTGIKEYETKPIDEAIDRYSELLENMKQIYLTKNYLQIDTKLTIDQASISRYHLNQLEETARYLVDLAKCVDYPNEIDNYRDEFIERYGVNTFVPILELLDDNLGLGAPSDYRFQPSVNKRKANHASFRSPLKDIILNKTLIAVKKGDTQISLDSNDLEKIKHLSAQQRVKRKIPPEFEMSFYVNLQCDGDLQFIIGPNGGSQSVGNSFGRFTHLFNKAELKQVGNLYQKKHELYKNEYIIIELQETPTAEKLGNIMTSMHVWTDCVLTSGNIYHENPNSINLHDVYVGIDRSTNGLCLYSKKHKKRIFAQMSSMLNPMYCSNAIRFMLEVTTFGYFNAFSPFVDWVTNSNIFSPRILHKKIILSPASWTISKSYLRVKGNCSREDISAALAIFFEQWNIPKYVYIKENDNLLLINIDNTLHLNEVIRRLQKNNALVQLQEAFLPSTGNDNSINSFIFEVTVPFFLKHKDVEIKSINADVHCTSSFHSKHRNLFPFQSEWMYMKLYADVLRYDEFFSSLVSFFQEISTKGLITDYYFIRYFDTEPHIRLRIKLKDIAATTETLHHISKWSVDLYDSRLIHHIIYDIYERELERYGGVKVIELAELVFCIDSAYVLELLRSEKAKKLRYTLEVCSTMSIISILNCFDLDITEQIAVIESYRNPIAQKEFRSHRTDLMKLCQNARWIEKISDNAVLEYLCTKRDVAIRNYTTALNEQPCLTNTNSDIILSVVHMFCNRMNGNSSWEEKIMSLTYYTLYNYRSYQRILAERVKENV